MSAGRIYLSQEEQAFLMKMLETNNPTEAADKFVILMIEENADPEKTEQYIRKIMKRMK